MYIVLLLAQSRQPRMIYLSVFDPRKIDLSRSYGGWKEQALVEGQEGC